MVVTKKNSTQLYKTIPQLHNKLYKQHFRTCYATLQNSTKLFKTSQISTTLLQHYTQMYRTLQIICKNLTLDNFTTIQHLKNKHYATIHKLYQTIHNFTDLHTTLQSQKRLLRRSQNYNIFKTLQSFTQLKFEKLL